MMVTSMPAVKWNLTLFKGLLLVEKQFGKQWEKSRVGKEFSLITLIDKIVSKLSGWANAELKEIA